MFYNIQLLVYKRVGRYRCPTLTCYKYQIMKNAHFFSGEQQFVWFRIR